MESESMDSSSMEVCMALSWLLIRAASWSSFPPPPHFIFMCTHNKFQQVGIDFNNFPTLKKNIVFVCTCIWAQENIHFLSKHIFILYYNIFAKIIVNACFYTN